MRGSTSRLSVTWLYSCISCHRSFHLFLDTWLPSTHMLCTHCHNPGGHQCDKPSQILSNKKGKPLAHITECQWQREVQPCRGDIMPLWLCFPLCWLHAGRHAPLGDKEQHQGKSVSSQHSSSGPRADSHWLAGDKCPLLNQQLGAGVF